MIHVKYLDSEVLKEAIVLLNLNVPMRSVSEVLGVPLSTLWYHLRVRLPRKHPYTAERVDKLLKAHKSGRKAKETWVTKALH